MPGVEEVKKAIEAIPQEYRQDAWNYIKPQLMNYVRQKPDATAKDLISVVADKSRFWLRQNKLRMRRDAQKKQSAMIPGQYMDLIKRRSAFELKEKEKEVEETKSNLVNRILLRIKEDVTELPKEIAQSSALISKAWGPGLLLSLQTAPITSEQVTAAIEKAKKINPEGAQQMIDQLDAAAEGTPENVQTAWEAVKEASGDIFTVIKPIFTMLDIRFAPEMELISSLHHTVSGTSVKKAGDTMMAFVKRWPEITQDLSDMLADRSTKMWLAKDENTKRRLQGEMDAITEGYKTMQKWKSPTVAFWFMPRKSQELLAEVLAGKLGRKKDDVLNDLRTQQQDILAQLLGAPVSIWGRSKILKKVAGDIAEAELTVTGLRKMMKNAWEYNSDNRFVTSVSPSEIKDRILTGFQDVMGMAPGTEGRLRNLTMFKSQIEEAKEVIGDLIKQAEANRLMKVHDLLVKHPLVKDSPPGLLDEIESLLEAAKKFPYNRSAIAAKMNVNRAKSLLSKAVEKINETGVSEASEELRRIYETIETAGKHVDKAIEAENALAKAATVPEMPKAAAGKPGEIPLTPEPIWKPGASAKTAEEIPVTPEPVWKPGKLKSKRRPKTVKWLWNRKQRKIRKPTSKWGYGAKAEREISGPKGKEGVAISTDNVSAKVRYRVVEVDDLIKSHDTGFAPNANYPQELQPRIRNRAAARMNAEKRAKNIIPELLTEQTTLQSGPPIIGPDGVVEAGNGRVLSLEMAYKQHPNSAQAYKKYLIDNAERFGLKPEDISNMKAPVLVRERIGKPINRTTGKTLKREEFAAASNVAEIEAYSAQERSLADAERLVKNKAFEKYGVDDVPWDKDTFIHSFVKDMPQNEVNEISTSAGRLSVQGERRIKNAIMAQAYHEPKMIERLVESGMEESKNVAKGLEEASPIMAKLKYEIDAGNIPKEYDLTDDILTSVGRWEGRKATSLHKKDFVKQTDFAGELSDRLVAAYATLRGNAYKKFAEGLKNYAKEVLETAHIKHPSLVPPRSKLEIFKSAFKKAFGYEHEPVDSLVWWLRAGIEPENPKRGAVRAGLEFTKRQSLEERAFYETMKSLGFDSNDIRKLAAEHLKWRGIEIPKGKDPVSMLNPKDALVMIEHALKKPEKLKIRLKIVDKYKTIREVMAWKKRTKLTEADFANLVSELIGKDITGAESLYKGLEALTDDELIKLVEHITSGTPEAIGKIGKFKLGPLGIRKPPASVTPYGTAKKIYSKWGLMESKFYGTSIQEALAEADDLVKTGEHIFGERLKEILKPVTDEVLGKGFQTFKRLSKSKRDTFSKAMEYITDLLEGKRLPADVPKPLADKLQKAAEDLRKWYDDLFEISGIPEYQYREGYAPHITKGGQQNLLKDWLAEQSKIERDKNLKTFFAEHQRMFEERPNLERNAAIAAQVYMRSLLRKKYLGEAVRSLRHADPQYIKAASKVDEILMKARETGKFTNADEKSLISSYRELYRREGKKALADNQPVYDALFSKLRATGALTESEEKTLAEGLQKMTEMEMERLLKYPKEDPAYALRYGVLDYEGKSKAVSKALRLLAEERLLPAAAGRLAETSGEHALNNLVNAAFGRVKVLAEKYGLDSIADFAAHYMGPNASKKILRAYLNLTYSGGLGFPKLSSPIKNLTQQLHTISMVGPKAWALASKDVVTNWKAVAEDAVKYGVLKSFAPGLENEVQAYKTLLNAGKDALLKPFSLSDKTNRLISFKAGERAFNTVLEKKGIDRALEFAWQYATDRRIYRKIEQLAKAGKTAEAAKYFGRAVSDEGQWVYSALYGPTYMRTVGGQFVGQFTTWPEWYLNFVKRRLFHRFSPISKEGMKYFTQHGLKWLARYTAGVWATSALAAEAGGFDIKGWFPFNFPGWVTRSVIKAVGGDPDKMPVVRYLPSGSWTATPLLFTDTPGWQVIMALNDLLQGLYAYGADPTQFRIIKKKPMDKAIERLEAISYLFLPGGLGMRQIANAIQNWETGKKRVGFIRPNKLQMAELQRKGLELKPVIGRKRGTLKPSIKGYEIYKPMTGAEVIKRFFAPLESVNEAYRQVDKIKSKTLSGETEDILQEIMPDELEMIEKLLRKVPENERP